MGERSVGEMWKNRSTCKRISVMLIGAMLLCLFIGCTGNEGGSQTTEPTGQTGTETVPPAETLPSAEQGDTSTGLAVELYRDILLGNQPFVSTSSKQKELTLENLREEVSDDSIVTVKATQFSLVDLTRDGVQEIVLRIQADDDPDYGFEVLHEHDGIVYGSSLPYGEFHTIKTDGTFSFSSDSGDSGFGALLLSETGYDIVKLSYLESKSAEEIHYYVNDTECTPEDYDEALGEQDWKPDVNWYDLTEDGIEMAFEAGC